MSKMKSITAVALSLVAVSAAVYAAPWNPSDMRPEVQVQLDPEAVRANLKDEYAALANSVGLNEKSQAAYDRYVQARIKADGEHAQWHNENAPKAQTRQEMMDWRAAHHQMRTNLDQNVIALRGELMKTMTPEQIANFDRYEPGPMRNCGTMRGMHRGDGSRMGMRGAHHMRANHMDGYHMAGNWHRSDYGRHGSGCRW